MSSITEPSLSATLMPRLKISISRIVPAGSRTTPPVTTGHIITKDTTGIKESFHVSPSETTV